MKTDLPKPAEYYRPNRARELEDKAARLRPWADGVGILAILSVVVMVFGALGATVLEGHLMPSMISGALLIGGGCCFLSLLLVYGRLCVRVGDYSDQAAHLKAEHTARYGPLPADESQTQHLNISAN
jgi:hypothetical protein